MKRTKATPESKERRAELNRQQWADPEYKARVGASISAALLRPETSEVLSRGMTERWADAEFRERMTKALSIAQATPTARTNHSRAMRRRMAVPSGMEQLRKAIARAQEVCREIHADPVRHAEIMQRILASRAETYAGRKRAHTITATEVMDATMALIIDSAGNVRSA